MPIEEMDQIPNINYKFVFMMDLFSQDILGNGIIEDSLKYIEDAVKEGVNVLVHCEAGVSRSVTIVTAYVMRRYKWNLDKAITFIQKSRPVACPNISFLQQLGIFEKLNYRADSHTLATSKIYRTYCADSGIPVPSLNSSNNKMDSIEEATSSLASFKIISNNDAQLATKKANHPLQNLNSNQSLSNQNRFRCRRCRTELFHERHLMYHTKRFSRIFATKNFEQISKAMDDSVFNSTPEYDDDEEAKKPRSYTDLDEENGLCKMEYLLTPMKWMDLSENQGKIHCFKCKEKLGQYSWSGHLCSGDGSGLDKCGTFVSPWLHIQKCKVDMIKVGKQDVEKSISDQNFNKSSDKEKSGIPNVVITLSQ